MSFLERFAPYLAFRFCRRVSSWAAFLLRFSMGIPLWRFYANKAKTVMRQFCQKLF